MSSPKRKRDVPVLFWVSADEMELIQQKMAQFGTKNLSAYLRKMAVDGYVVQLDLPELKELVSLLRRSSNNLNQLTRSWVRDRKSVVKGKSVELGGRCIIKAKMGEHLPYKQSLPPRRNRSRSDEQSQAQAGCAGSVLGIR